MSSDAIPLRISKVNHYSTYNKIFIHDHDGLFTEAPHLPSPSHCTVKLSGSGRFWLLQQSVIVRLKSCASKDDVYMCVLRRHSLLLVVHFWYFGS